MKEEFETKILASNIRMYGKYCYSQYKLNFPIETIKKLGLKKGDRVHITIEKSSKND